MSSEGYMVVLFLGLIGVVSVVLGMESYFKHVERMRQIELCPEAAR